MGEKSVSNILNALEKSRIAPLERLVFALGIRHVGEETAELMAKHFPSMDKLSRASREQLTAVPTIGPKIADSLIAFFRQEDNNSILEKLRNAGVKMEAEKTGPRILEGVEFVITGRMESFSRQEAEEKIRELGGTASSNVSKKTSYLVVGADPGSKLAKARELGTQQLTEEAFLRLLEGKQK